MRRPSMRRRRPTATTVVALLLAFLGWLLKDRLPQQPTRPSAASPAVRTDVAPLPGRCTKVIDGDTYEVALAEGRRRIRVKGIDCPESSESEKALRQADRLGVALPALLDAGRGIKAEARRALEGREVVVVPPGGLLEPDSYGRLLAYVEVGGQDVGADLIARGLAYARDEPHPRRSRYYDLNRQARHDRLGIYAGLVQ